MMGFNEATVFFDSKLRRRIYKDLMKQHDCIVSIRKVGTKYQVVMKNANLEETIAAQEDLKKMLFIGETEVIA